jgi:NADH dehydrogenase [ubiquinone] 1 alpha subcomplex assembly factor 5
MIPSADPRDMSNLMSRAGFTLLTVDVDEVSIGYPTMWELLDDLRDMGENNAIIGRWVLHNRLVHAKAHGRFKSPFLA